MKPAAAVEPDGFDVDTVERRPVGKSNGVNADGEGGASHRLHSLKAK